MPCTCRKNSILNTRIKTMKLTSKSCHRLVFHLPTETLKEADGLLQLLHKPIHDKAVVVLGGTQAFKETICTNLQ